MEFLQRMHNLLIGCLLSLCITNIATATTIQDLVQQGKLQIEVRLAPAVNEELASGTATTDGKAMTFSPRQQVDLYIQVKTDRWFAGGTYISPFSVDNSLVLQRNKLANNYAQRDNGVTWSVQDWQLTLYPQTSGEYVIPAIPVHVSIATAPGEKVSGTLLTNPLMFQVALPDARLTSEVDWVVAADLAFNQHWNVNPDAELKVGDAITRTITLSARETSIMLLPDFSPFESDKVQSYSDKTLAKDSQNRGDFYAEKTIKHTYIIQQSGPLRLPELKLLWWNSKTQKLTTLAITDGNWSVQHTLASFIRAYQTWLLAGVVLSVFIGYGTMRLWQKYKQAKLPHSLMLMINIYRQKWPQCNRDLYNQHYIRSGQTQLRASGSEGSLLSDPHAERVESTVIPESRRARIITRWSAQQYSESARWQSHSCKQQGLFLTLWLAIRGK